MAISLEEFAALKPGDDVYICQRYPSLMAAAGRVVAVTKTGKKIERLSTNATVIFVNPQKVRGSRYGHEFLGNENDFADIQQEIYEKNKRREFRDARDVFAKVHPDSPRSELLAELEKVREKILEIPEISC